MKCRRINRCRELGVWFSLRPVSDNMPDGVATSRGTVIKEEGSAAIGRVLPGAHEDGSGLPVFLLGEVGPFVEGWVLALAR